MPATESTPNPPPASDPVREPSCPAGWLRVALAGVIAAGLMLLVYWPALRGGFVWDDDSWTTGISGLLRDASGLGLMWFQPTALQQYYPLTGTTFWLDHQFWKFWTTPYHVENVLLHALAALLFWRLLLRLRLPGAWLAAALFALHPVMVESVAWITERKNVLSLVLFLGALLAYERYAPWTVETDAMAGPPRDKWPRSLFYGLAFVLFLGALLAKTATFSLPAVILLIGWWKRGRIRWREDVVPTLPFFALALGLCAVTSWLEKNSVGAEGSDFALTFPQRCLVAGRAFWFYLGSLFWPANLCFIYPRWQPDPAVWWQWLYPVAAVGALSAPWLARRRIGRGPATAMFFYVGTLFPVLGFMNAYGMRYSYVWDHWVYLSALGIIALVAALVAQAAATLRRPGVTYGFAVVVLPVFALLTWRQAGIFTGMETLWRTTLAKNPDAWIARSNLGNVLLDQGRADEAFRQFQAAVRLKPDSVEIRYSYGVALLGQGRLDEAAGELREAIRLRPDYAYAHDNLGAALFRKGQIGGAIGEFQEALRLKPDHATAHYNLGLAFYSQGRLDGAISEFSEAVRLQPDYADARNDLGVALLSKGRLDEAISEFQAAVRLKPDDAGARDNLARALEQKNTPAGR